MTDRTTAITGTVGEHFVAARLAGLGYVVALTRGGSPTADILVSTQDGKNTLAIQVKTSSSAWRERMRKPADSKWEWPMSWREVTPSPNLWYAFVDLKDWPSVPELPVVFLVPSSVVAADQRHAKAENWGQFCFYLFREDAEKYQERWELLQKALES